MAKCYEEILWGSVMGERMGKCYGEILWGSVMEKCYEKCYGEILRKFYGETLWANVMVKFNGEVLWGNFTCMGKCYGKMMCTEVYFICYRIFVSVNTAKI